ncbi:hypothetical protein I7I50_05634 [Histoplasma capsulatum G186AR]|uniref:Uncharacterized protein n=1 Tax=Ajellomyces capsulatus TaxID=5037 RepID=A0A8H8D7W4_AJECA|nr:hypothetical protein I7I52_03894 [Histoplasma capsulatum]QSS76246.1 hypothetical protein I7I50_05634 [Histoplasma capsulatum G186AR]
MTGSCMSPTSNPDSASDEFKPSASRGSGRRASASQTQTHPKPNARLLTTVCLECFVYEACIFSIFSQKPVKPPLASA